MDCDQETSFVLHPNEDGASYPAFSTLTAQTLYSGIFAIGSSAGLVSILVGLSAKWNVIEMTPGAESSVTFALAVTSPRRENRQSGDIIPIFKS